MRRVRIEKTGPDSAGHLAQVHALCFSPHWSEREIAAMMHMSTTAGFLVRRGDEAVGMALFRVAAGEAEVLTIAIVPAMRGQRVGADLLACGEADALAQGTRRVFLEVSTLNTAAQALYSRVGYREIGRRRGYYADGSDALVLEKALGNDRQDSGVALMNRRNE
ncbi:ribosomal protein S18-alanine N-acetyltransferase [uncultured Maricaulis sp.]|uniref:ribosomal protein S18-alanine N-acetyltransferase n=1 Tax=uncultured Maricaulis sp. TaxID=174710 RepID=UPI0030DC26D4|tara:strand:- start:129285 stop:129776 length:492 start_codon:yes stop_codon:yes gene_type:complete